MEGSSSAEELSKSELRHHPPLSLLPLNSIRRSDSQLTVCQSVSSRSPALKSPALILQINKPCAECCSRPGLFSASFPSPPSSPVQNVFVKSVSPSQARANRACSSSITDPSRNQLESWRCCAAIRPLTAGEERPRGFKMSRFVCVVCESGHYG